MRRSLLLENLALRQQLVALKRRPKTRGKTNAEHFGRVISEGTFEPFFYKHRWVSLEKVATRALWPFGKVIALGEPGYFETYSGTSPQTALRIEVRENWQTVVGNLIQDAEHLLMNVGNTVGLKWELEHLARAGLWEKLTLILRHDTAPAMAKAWRQLFSDSPQLLACPDEVIARSVAVRFSPEGRQPIFFSVKRRSVASYEVALAACRLPLDRLLGTIPNYAETIERHTAKPELSLARDY